MNEIIKLIAEKGLSSIYRDMSIVFGAVVIIIMCFWYGAKLGLSKRVRLLSILIAYPFLMLLLDLITIVSDYLASMNFLGIRASSYSGVKVFVFLPLVSWIVSKILKIEWVKIADLFAVIRLAEYPVSSLGCLFAGCCRGYPCEWGLYSPSTEQNYFPVQIVNAIVMVLIIVFLIHRAKKMEYKADGKQLPIMLCLFGVTRILTEFMTDSEKVILGFSMLSLYCIVMIIIGFVTLTIIKRNEKKEAKSTLTEATG